MARKNSDQEKPPTLGYVPRGVASKDAGVACSQDARRKLWAIHPFAWGMEQGNGPGTAQEPDARMDAPPLCSSSFTTIGTESRPRCSSQSIAYRREAKEAAGLSPLAECH